MSKAFAALRLWDIFSFFSPFWDDNKNTRRTSPKPKRGNSRTSRSRGGLWGDATVSTTQGWKKHPKKNTRNVDFNTRNDTFTPENKNLFSPQNIFLQQKLFYTRNTCASEAEVSLQQTHFASSSANLLHHRKSLTPHTFAGAQIPGNDLEVKGSLPFVPPFWTPSQPGTPSERTLYQRCCRKNVCKHFRVLFKWKMFESWK